MSIEGYFFYSRKQNEMCVQPKDKDTYAKLDNGDIVLYSEMRDIDKPFGTWDDYVFLGHGKFHHMEDK